MEQIFDFIIGSLFDILSFIGVLSIFVLARYVLQKNIKAVSKEKKIVHENRNYKHILLQIFFSITIVVFYIISLALSISIFQKLLVFIFSLAALHICILYIHKKILLYYGEEVEVSGQKYFRKGYEANLYSLLINGLGFVLGVFLFIHIFEINSLIQIGGLWAGILAFMGFTAPVWALDMIAGIILLQSKNYIIGNVYYIEEQKMYIWIKNISLTEVKCIDLRFGNPLIYRPSQFRNLTLRNISQGIDGKSNKVLREIDIHIGYDTDINNIKQVCYDAYEEMLQALKKPKETNYFGDDGFISLEIFSFEDYAVKYKLFYSITSAFYILKAERVFNEFLLKHQVKNNIFFATPDLIDIKKSSI
ncbi:mechanosensitive ion channel family protein [Candidatus Gracilibacteria bacterium]|nr:mechanosensitive ion channel family protein [Candidatus Gracilibacteria bacterium]